MNRQGVEEVQQECELWKTRYNELNTTNEMLLRRNAELESTSDRFQAWLAEEFATRSKVVQTEVGSEIDPIVAAHHLGVAKGIRLADAEFQNIMDAECR